MDTGVRAAVLLAKDTSRGEEEEGEGEMVAGGGEGESSPATARVPDCVHFDAAASEVRQKYKKGRRTKKKRYALKASFCTMETIADGRTDGRPRLTSLAG